MNRKPYLITMLICLILAVVVLKVSGQTRDQGIYGWGERTVKNEFLSNGKKVTYQLCHSNPLVNKNYGNNWVFLDSSKTTYHNGVENIWDKMHYFFNFKMEYREPLYYTWDSIYYNYDTSRIIRRFTDGKLDSIPSTLFMIKTADTLPCIMLVCDTSEIYTTWEKFEIDLDKTNRYRDTTKSIFPGFMGKTVIDTTSRYYISELHWQYGYSVTSNLSYKTTYLDADKRPLPKSIVVWQSKLLNENK